VAQDARDGFKDLLREGLSDAEATRELSVYEYLRYLLEELPNRTS